MVKPARRRHVVEHLQGAYEVSQRRACRATGFDRGSHRYQSRRDPQTELRVRLKDLAASRVRYGYRRLHILLKREGWQINHKRIHRLYREEGLGIRAKIPRRKRTVRYREARTEIEAVNHVWTMDFVSDRLFNQRSFRILAMVDCFTRECLAIEPKRKFQALNVIEALDRVMAVRGRPKSIRVELSIAAPLVQAQWTTAQSSPAGFLISGRTIMVLSLFGDVLEPMAYRRLTLAPRQTL